MKTSLTECTCEPCWDLCKNNVFQRHFEQYLFRGNVKLRGQITDTTAVSTATVVPGDAAYCVRVRL